MRVPASIRLLRRLRREEDGVTLVEFAIVAPVLMLMLIGLFDIAHTQYTSALLHGAMQKSARDLTLESAPSSEAELDQRVIDQVSNVVPASATITIEKTSHNDFADIGEEEEYTDENGDGVCNNGEFFVDTNGNGQWDAVSGSEGIGGAYDAVLYTVIVKYDRMFPMYSIAGMTSEVELSASTVLRNQPYDTYTNHSDTGNCD